MVTDRAQRQLIVDISRDVVLQLAPQELPVFRAQSRAYLADPGSTLESHGKRDSMLGFDLGATATLLTPIVLAVTTRAVEFLLQEARESLGTQSAGLIDDLESIGLQLGRTRESYDAESARVAALSESLRLARLRYENGVASQLDVLDAERGLLSAQIARIEALRAHRAAVADLFRALGG